MNKSLDGTWNVVKIGANAVPTGLSYTFKFTKEKDGKGVFELSQVYTPLPAYIEKGTYTLIQDSKIILTFSPEQNDTCDIISYSKSNLII